MNLLNNKLTQLYSIAAGLLDKLQPVALLAARVYVANVFFSAGLTKIRDWDSTLFLFEEEYNVPFLNFEVAAYMGTAGELILPILLFFGFASRFGALGLTVVNVIAVLSLEDIAPAALNEHITWGILIFMIVLWGAGKLSVDHFLQRRLGKPQS